MPMTSRERVLTAIAHREPDRVPYNLRVVPELLDMVKSKIGTEDYAEYFGHDIVYIPELLPPVPPKPDGVPVTEWTPRPTDEDIAGLKKQVQALHARGIATCGGYYMGVFERAKDWIGDEATLVGPYEDPEGFANMLDRIVEWKCALYGSFVTAGTDIVFFGDDLGTQRSLVMSVKQYREWYKPRHQRLINHLRSIRSDVKIAFHSCGHVTPIIPDFIEIGIDILEAVQAECMDIAQLKREFGKDIVFWGGVGAQSVLARTTPEQVIEGVRQTLRVMSPGGGYIARPCHTLMEEVPWESIAAFHKAVQTYGAYPHPGDE
jgi:uroporphyrinogen decarboxylase